MRTASPGGYLIGGKQMEYVIFIGLIVLAIVIVGVVASRQQTKKFQQLRAIQTFSVGKYLSGLTNPPLNSEHRTPNAQL